MSDTWTRGHTPDTHRIRIRYVTWRIIDHIVGQRFWTRHGYGSNTVRTRLVDLVPGFNRKKKEEGRREKGEGRRATARGSGSRLQQKEEGRREKGEGGRGEDELGAWGGGSQKGGWVGEAGGEHEEVGSQKRGRGEGAGVPNKLDGVLLIIFLIYIFNYKVKLFNK